MTSLGKAFDFLNFLRTRQALVCASVGGRHVLWKETWSACPVEVVKLIGPSLIESLLKPCKELPGTCFPGEVTRDTGSQGQSYD